MYLLLSVLFVSVFSAPDSITNQSNDHLLIEHSVTQESAKNAIKHLEPDLSKTNVIRVIKINNNNICLI